MEILLNIYCCLQQSGPNLSFQIRVKGIVSKASVAVQSVKEPPGPWRIGHKLLTWSCRGCLCLSVHHSGTCGFSYPMFYCSTMFLPWSSAHCIKTTLSPPMPTREESASLYTHAHAGWWWHQQGNEPAQIKVPFFLFDQNTSVFHCPVQPHSPS